MPPAQSGIWPEAQPQQAELLAGLFDLFGNLPIPQAGEDYLDRRALSQRRYRDELRSALAASGLAKQLGQPGLPPPMLSKYPEAAQLLERWGSGSREAAGELARWLAANAGSLLGAEQSSLSQQPLVQAGHVLPQAVEAYLLVVLITVPASLGAFAIGMRDSEPDWLSPLLGLTAALTAIVLPLLLFERSQRHAYIYFAGDIAVNARWYITLAELYLYLRGVWCGR